MTTQADRIVVKPSWVESPKGLRFVIMDLPNESNLPTYVEHLKKKSVKYVVRACESSYATNLLEDVGIQVVDLPFPDGHPPPAEFVAQWLSIVEETFEKQSKDAIAVHCIAGLGRAPVLVAIALVESGMAPHEAIELIRKKRRGAINSRQLEFIKNYQRTGSTNRRCCVIS